MFFTRTPQVEEIMSKEMVTISEQGSIYEALTFMLKSSVNDIFITNRDGKIIGLLTMSDISAAIKGNESFETPIWMKMKKNLVTIAYGKDILDARNLMIQKQIGRVPVVHKGSICGVIRIHEIMNYYYNHLEDSWTRLNISVDSLHEAVCVVDCEGRVVVWNKKSESLYGLSNGKMIGRPLKTYFKDALILKVLEEKKPFESACHEPRANYQVAISAKPLYSSDGQFIGAISSERDISEVKKLSDELSRVHETVHYLEQVVDSIGENVFGSIIGQSDAIKSSIELSKKVAKSTASILIYGESGTGKEVFARAIYKQCQCGGLFIPVNCSAIPDQLFESEFFGYEAGAFTGASKKGKMGIFELGNDGVVFLDEIADLPMHMQAKLLRVLQEGEVRRIGAEKSREVNCRIISATNKNLEEMVMQGLFREDLYFRLNVIQMTLPPLRDRKDDIKLLTMSFLKEICDKNKMDMPRITNEAMQALQSYSWKGNIRELKNIVESMTVLCVDGLIDIDSVPKYIQGRSTAQGVQVDDFDLKKRVEELEVETIRASLKKAKGKKAKAAQYLNIPRSTLYYKMDQYGIEE